MAIVVLAWTDLMAVLAGWGGLSEGVDWGFTGIRWFGKVLL